MRSIVTWLHRWVALLASVIIVLLGVTGSILVFEGAIDRGLHPELWRVETGRAVLPLDTLVARARAAAPGRAIGNVTLGKTADRAFVAQAGPTQVFLNPYSGAVLGTRDRAALDRSLPRRAHRLHVNLMSGAIGRAIVGAATVISFLLVISGIYLWWKEKRWQVRWSASWKRIAFDLHHSLGVTTSLILLVILASGMVIHYDVLGRAIARIGATAGARAPEPVQQAFVGIPISMDSAARIAASALPGAVVSIVSVPGSGHIPIVVTMHFPEDRTPVGRSRVYIDAHTGAVLETDNTRNGGTGARLATSMRSIHTGDVFGKPTEGLWMLAALVLASQALSGVLMWWNGRPARSALKRAGRRRASAGSTELGVTEAGNSGSVPS